MPKSKGYLTEAWTIPRRDTQTEIGLRARIAQLTYRSSSLHPPNASAAPFTALPMALLAVFAASVAFDAASAAFFRAFSAFSRVEPPELGLVLDLELELELDELRSFLSDGMSMSIQQNE